MTEDSRTQTDAPRPQDHLRPFRPKRDKIRSENGNANAVASTGETNKTEKEAENEEEDDEDTIPPLPTVTAHIHACVQSFLAESHPPDSLLAAVQRQTRTSLDVVSTALSRYSLSELSVSYNGGKDCLVLLILFLAGLHPYLNTTTPTTSTMTNTNNHHPNESETPHKNKIPKDIPAIYALPPDPFPAVEDFVLSSAKAYHLQITKYTTAPPTTTLRSSFEDYLTRNPGIRAIFVGTRRTDPHGARLTHFDRTDRGWPDFMRVHPVIDWHYAEIWAFIRHLGLRYCVLYDRGYTSLGGTSDTHPNPRLRIGTANRSGDGSSDGGARYRPAYELTEDVEERLGRD